MYDLRKLRGEEKRRQITHWAIVLSALFGFGISLAIHVATYFDVIAAEIFLLYCRVLWVGVAILALLIGLYMPTARPVRQLKLFLALMVAATVILLGYAVYFGVLYVTSDHPVRREERFVVQKRGQIVREISVGEYRRLAEAERRYYIAYLNRTFSAIWLLIYLGLGLYGLSYLLYARRDAGARAADTVPWWY